MQPSSEVQRERRGAGGSRCERFVWLCGTAGAWKKYNENETSSMLMEMNAMSAATAARTGLQLGRTSNPQNIAYCIVTFKMNGTIIYKRIL